MDTRRAEDMLQSSGVYYGGMPVRDADVAEVAVPEASRMHEEWREGPHDYQVEYQTEGVGMEGGDDGAEDEVQSPFSNFDEAELCAQVADLEAGHNANTARIDSLQRELRATGLQLVRLAQEEEDAQALADQKWVDSERAKSEQEWFLKTLQDEYENLVQSVRERDEFEAEVHRKYSTALESSGDDLADPKEPLVAVVLAKEQILRELEDRHIDADDLLRINTATLHALREEHDQMVKDASRFFTSSELEMKERQLKSGSITHEYKAAVALRKDLEERKHYVRSNKVQAEAYHAECVAMNRKLEDDLQRIVAARDRDAAQLDAGMAHTIGEEGSGERLAKLDEVMMVLKGLGINVCNDYRFCGDLYAVWGCPEDALAGFEVAFQYLTEYIEAVHGAQQEGMRWRFTQVYEARYDEVEALLSSIKQMIACYDLLGPQQKRRIERSLDIVHNASHLQRMAVDNTQKFAEMVEARDVQKREDQEKKEARVKMSLERQRLKTAKRKKETDLHPSERPQRSASAMSTITSVSKQTQIRSASPRLAPIRFK